MNAPRLRVSRSRSLLVLLWPLLWWGYSAALYCAPVQQLAPPPVPLRIDLSGVSQSDIEQTVRHLQAIVRAADARAVGLELNLADEHTAHIAAQNEAAALQLAMDAANDRATKAEAEAAIQAKWKWRWFWAWLGTVALVAAFFIARQYVPFLKLL